MKNYLHLPNILTLTRLIVAPLAMPLLLYYLLPYNSPTTNSVLAGLFVVFNLTDFFDGYLARKYSLESKFGQFLDPLADKFLCFSVIIALTAVGKLYFYWAIIFVARDFFMMGLRLMSLEHGISLSVSSSAKVKTALLMAYLTLVVMRTSLTMFDGSYWGYGEFALLVISLFLTVWTAMNYCRLFLNHYTRTAQS